MKSAEGGCLYIPASNKPESHYFRVNRGIILPSYIEIAGDGPNSHIRNTLNPNCVSNSGECPDSKNLWYPGTIFYTTNYAAFSKDNVVEVKTGYPTKNIKAGSNTATIQKSHLLVLKRDYTDSVGRLQNLVGELVVFEHGLQYMKTSSRRAKVMQINKIETFDYDTGTITFEDSFYYDYLYDKKNQSYPKMYLANTGKYLMRIEENENHADIRRDKFMTERVYVHDLKFSQHYRGQNTASVMQLGGTYKSQFYNLDIESGSGFPVGNMITKSIYQNITLSTKRSVIDLGYGSSGNVIQNYTVTYDGRYPDFSLKSNGICEISQGSALFYFNEGSNANRVSDITVTGTKIATNNSHLINVSSSHGITITDIVINMPGLNFMAGTMPIAYIDKNCTNKSKAISTNLSGSRHVLEIGGYSQAFLPTDHIFKNITGAVGGLSSQIHTRPCNNARCPDQNLEFKNVNVRF